jgi:hypothetical protein
LSCEIIVFKLFYGAGVWENDPGTFLSWENNVFKLF